MSAFAQKQMFRDSKRWYSNMLSTADEAELQHVTWFSPCRYVQSLIPVPARSKACDYGHSLAGIAGSNPAEGMEVCIFLSVVCCLVEVTASG